MIESLDQTIQAILEDAIPPFKERQAEVSFEQPTPEWSGRLSKPTLDLFLYDVQENNALRQQQWEQLPGNSGLGQAQRKRRPVRVDCKYLISCWASIPEDEHRLMTHVMLALFRYPVLPKDLLVGELQNSTFEIQTQLAQQDQSTNLADIWSALGNKMRLAISYVVTVALDPWQVITTPIVTTWSLRVGRSGSLPDKPSLIPHAQNFEINSIGGMVRDGKQNGKPVSGIQVAIKGTGLFATTDENGRFALGSLPSGSYTLVAWPPEAKPRQKAISIPEKEDNYDIVI